jgi:ABC-type transport system substrate-binding protein
MTNFGDFWEPRGKKEIRKSRFDNRLSLMKKISKIIFQIRFFLVACFKSFYLISKNFFGRLFRLPKVLNRIDKIALLVLCVILLALLGFKFNKDWFSKTKTIPAIGGTYTEVLIGEAKYLNPILAKSDTDRTINHLIYSGLTKIDSSGNVVADLAQSWEISPDGKTYKFVLKDNVLWQDGDNFSATDVVETIGAIKNQNIKSPYYESWKDVQVESPDEKTVIFQLKNSYGPFIYNTEIGIIPSHIDPSSISSSPVGTGQYKFQRAISGKNKNIEEVQISRSDSYYGTKPYISEVNFKIAVDEDQARKKFSYKETSSISGLIEKGEGISNYSFPTSRNFGLVFNLAKDPYKDLNLRKKISSTESFDPKISIKLLVLDKPLSVSTAVDLQTKFADRGITIEIDKKGAIEYSNLLSKKDYETVLYGFDYGYDRDPYPYWHSSQIANGNNFSGFSNKQADLILEAARMTADTQIRNQKYDDLYKIINEQTPVIFLSKQEFNFSVKNSIKGITAIAGFEPWDHLNDFANWYIKTKRVKP